MNKKLLAFIFSVLVIFIAVGLNFYSYFRKPHEPQTDMILLKRPTSSLFKKILQTKPQPTNLSSLLCQINKINGNNIMVSTKNKTFNITLNSQTKIIKPSVYVPYLFKKDTNSQELIMTSTELKPGQIITVDTDNNSTATVIQFVTISNQLNGAIKTVGQNSITISSLQPTWPASVPPPTGYPTVIDYTITVNSDTEISQQNKKLAFANLKVGQGVNIYTSEDTALNTNLTALAVKIMP